MVMTVIETVRVNQPKTDIQTKPVGNLTKELLPSTEVAIRSHIQISALPLMSKPTVVVLCQRPPAFCTLNESHCTCEITSQLYNHTASLLSSVPEQINLKCLRLVLRCITKTVFTDFWYVFFSFSKNYIPVLPIKFFLNHIAANMHIYEPTDSPFHSET